MSQAERNRRECERTDYRTSVTIVVPQQDGTTRAIKGWSADISITGASLVSMEELTVDQIYLRFLMPGAAERLIQAEVVRALETVVEDFHSNQMTVHSYGVKFKKVIEDKDQIAALLQTA